MLSPKDTEKIKTGYLTLRAPRYEWDLDIGLKMENQTLRNARIQKGTHRLFW